MGIGCMIQSASSAEMLAHAFEALIVGVAGGFLVASVFVKFRPDEEENDVRKDCRR